MNEIYLEIERLRRDLVSCAERKGLTDPLVLDISRQIDNYLNLLLQQKKPGGSIPCFPSGRVYDGERNYAVQLLPLS